jgi:2-methylisocitrate lyase-like PEP mutase family enzyme
VNAAESVHRSAARLRELHAQPPLIVLNAWDAASAALVAAAGASVIGTTSAGISWATGVPDGGSLGRERAVEAVRSIVNAVTVPVTADIERGYGTEPEDVGQTVIAVIDAGAAGINLEDSSADGSLLNATLQQERLCAARAASEDAGAPIWINARPMCSWSGTHRIASGSPTRVPGRSTTPQPEPTVCSFRD